MTRAVALGIVCAALVGCGQNAVLELTIDLPAIETGDWCSARPGTAPRFAFVQPRASDNPFSDEWPPDDLPAIELGTARIEDHVSVVTDDTSLDVHLKIRFCHGEACGDFCDATSPERWYVLEHPFYEGKRTTYEIVVDDIPTTRPAEPEVVERCRVRGCLTGTPLTSYCTTDGRHVCDD